MTLQGFKILLVIAMLLSIGIVGVGGYKKVTGKSVSITPTTINCGHETYWQRTDENGDRYCQSCSIDRTLSLTLPNF